MRRSSGSSRRPRAKRRKLIWARVTNEAGVTVIADVFGTPTSAPTRVNLLAGFETAYGANLIGVTILRTRGIMGIQLPNATEDFGVRAGIKVTDDISSTVVAADNLYDPAATGGAHDDWMLWEPFFVPRHAATPLGTHLDGSGLPGRVIDVKSTRRLSELGQALVLDMNSQSTAGADPVVFFDLSLLLALP